MLGHYSEEGFQPQFNFNSARTSIENRTLEEYSDYSYVYTLIIWSACLRMTVVSKPLNKYQIQGLKLAAKTLFFFLAKGK